MGQLSHTIENGMGLGNTEGSLYLRTPSDLINHPELAPIAHSIRQAWEELKLSAVLCIDGQPTAYFKEQNRFTADQKDKLIRFLWNQGTATKLILISQTTIEIHSGLARPPAQAHLPWSQGSLVESLDRLADNLESHRLGTLLRRIETGQFFRDYPDKFNPDNAVDKCLLTNLRDARDQLRSITSATVENIHALLGRLLFISFLEAREFITAKHFPGRTKSLKEFLKSNSSQPEKGIELLYQKLFRNLQKEFNGSMFSTSMEEEQSQLTTEGFILLAQLFQGDEIASGQLMLAFWAYDFGVIPVETISSIYEDFLEAEDSVAKHALGAYYTPRHLAEFVVNLAVREGKKVEQWKFIDPSCGSGVFLVIAFNLLAEHWLYRSDNNNHRRHKTTKINQLIEILCNQIRGTDLNPTACRIAAFSLYLALFEKVRPVDLEEFKKKLEGKPILPNLLQPTPRNRDGTAVVTCHDFNQLPETFPRDFDCAIGNPPWKGRGKTQNAFPFVDKISNYLKPEGQTSFVLPATMLVLKNSTLKRDWLRGKTVTDIVNLADYQNVLFTGPKLPCLVLKFHQQAAAKEHEIRYYTPKITEYDPRQGMVCIEPGDLKIISQFEIESCDTPADFRLLWLTNYYGTPRDLRFIQRLRRMPRLEDYFSPTATNTGLPKFEKGVGFQPYYPGESKTKPSPLSPWKLSDPYLPSRNLGELFTGPNDWAGNTLGKFLKSHTSRKGTPASTKVLRRRPDEGLFEPPMVLLNLGFTTAAYCSQKVRFQHAIHSISGDATDSKYLKLLAALFNSDLVAYFNFHCAARWIAGRNQVHIDDKMLIPFPPPNSPHLSKGADEVLEKIEVIFNQLQESQKKSDVLKNEAAVEFAKEELNELIFQYFGVTDSERILIEDTKKLWSTSTRKNRASKSFPAIESPSESNLTHYNETLTGVLNSWAQVTESGNTVRVEGRKNPQGLRLRLLHFKIGPRTKKRRRAMGPPSDEEGFEAALGRMEAALSNIDAPFQYLRGLTFFEGRNIYLLKPNTKRHWSGTTALNDADEILAHLKNSYLREAAKK